MTNRTEKKRRVGLTSGSQGEINPNTDGDNDDIIYVDLTKDPESQNWLGSPAEKRTSYEERVEQEKEDLRKRFQEKLEKLDR